MKIYTLVKASRVRFRILHITQTNLQIHCYLDQNSSGCFFHRNTYNSKIFMELQNSPNSQNNLERNKAEGVMSFDLKLHHKCIVIKKV